MKETPAGTDWRHEALRRARSVHHAALGVMSRVRGRHGGRLTVERLDAVVAAAMALREHCRPHVEGR